MSFLETKHGKIIGRENFFCLNYLNLYMPASNEHQEGLIEQESCYLWRKKRDSQNPLYTFINFMAEMEKERKRMQKFSCMN